MTDLPRSFQFKDILDFRDTDAMTEPTERDRGYWRDQLCRAFAAITKDWPFGPEREALYHVATEALNEAREEGRREERERCAQIAQRILFDEGFLGNSEQRIHSAILHHSDTPSPAAQLPERSR